MQQCCVNVVADGATSAHLHEDMYDGTKFGTQVRTQQRCLLRRHLHGAWAHSGDAAASRGLSLQPAAVTAVRQNRLQNLRDSIGLRPDLSWK